MTKTSAAGLIFLQPSEYFHGAINGAMSSLKISASDYARNYLANLLSQFINMENLYPKDAEGRRADTLTQQLAHALEQESAERRAQQLRQMGDFSLYIAGFFSESFTRKLIDVDYYIGMGGAAYENVARLEEQKERSQLFIELAKKFPQFVDVLAQVSDEAGFHQDNDKALLRAYELWTKTGSERLAKQLVRAGIVPVHKKNGEDS